jgi:hypothetical protein
MVELHIKLHFFGFMNNKQGNLHVTGQFKLRYIFCLNDVQYLLSFQCFDLMKVVLERCRAD